MKYFAKLLPFDGELKEGDKCLHPEYGIGIFKGRNGLSLIGWESMHIFDDNYPEPKVEEINFSEKCDDLKPVKLFLCTQDVNVGDKDCAEASYSLLSERREIIGEVTDTIPHWIMNYTGDSNGHWPKNATFKVIGEISTNAIWVNDRDEFNEDEVSFGPHPLMRNNPALKDYDWGNTVRIKCDKCNTFH